MSNTQVKRAKPDSGGRKKAKYAKTNRTAVHTSLSVEERRLLVADRPITFDHRAVDRDAR